MALLPSRQQLARAEREGWADWIVTKQDEIAVARGCYFDVQKANATRLFIESYLTHGKAPFDGSPFILEPWQWFEVVGPIYGWKMPSGERRFLSAFVFIPKKNGKTQLAAALSIRELFDQIGARCFMTAVSQEQLCVDGCFDEACGMVKRSPHLSDLIELLPSTNRMIIPSRNSMLVALPTSAGSSQGKNASAIIFEEFHEWKDREFYNSLLYSDSARVDSFACYITTAGDDLTSICYEEYERACRIRDGKDLSIDHLAVIYEAKKSAKFDDLKEWQRANPNYGVTLPERKIKRAIDQAKGSPQRIAALKRYRLNLWTKAKDGWIDPMRWDGL
ncbi:MAG: terminase large subunit domain-containing protein, partial [Planctomycetaceae bacterium]